MERQYDMLSKVMDSWVTENRFQILLLSLWKCIYQSPGASDRKANKSWIRVGRKRVTYPFWEGTMLFAMAMIFKYYFISFGRPPFSRISSGITLTHLFRLLFIHNCTLHINVLMQKWNDLSQSAFCQWCVLLVKIVLMCI